MYQTLLQFLIHNLNFKSFEFLFPVRHLLHQMRETLKFTKLFYFQDLDACRYEMVSLKFCRELAIRLRKFTREITRDAKYKSQFHLIKRHYTYIAQHDVIY